MDKVLEFCRESFSLCELEDNIDWASAFCRQMASESNATLHNAMRLHIDNLRLLAKPLDQLQREIPSMADIDEDSEANIAEVRTTPESS